MSDNALKWSFFGFVVLACGIGIWMNIKPDVCPVPAALLSQPGDSPPCFEFWFSRYQTLLAAILAIGGVAYATAPVSKQFLLLSEQAAHERKSRLLRRYRMISKAIELLDLPNLPWQDENSRFYVGATVAEANARATAATTSRRNWLDGVASKLRSIDLDAAELAIVEDGLKDAYANIAGQPVTGLQTNDPHWIWVLRVQTGDERLAMAIGRLKHILMSIQEAVKP